MSRVQGVRYWKAEELEYKTMRQGLLSLLSTFDRLQVQWAQSSSFAIRLVVSKTNIFWKNWSYNKWNLRKWKSESVFTLKWQHLSIFFSLSTQPDKSQIFYLIKGHPLFEPKLNLSGMVKGITKCPRVYRRAAYVRHISAEATHFQVVGSEQGWESQDFSAWASNACISSCLNFQRRQSAVTVEQPRWEDRLVRLLRDCCTSDKANGTNSLAHKFSETELTG